MKYELYRKQSLNESKKMDTTIKILQQNRKLIIYAALTVSGIFLVSGYITNEFVNLFLAILASYDSTAAIFRKKTLPELTHMLKCWVTLTWFVAFEYLFRSTIINATSLNVLFNIVKIVIMSMFNFSLATFYDLYIEKLYPVIESFCHEAFIVSTVNREYDAVFIITQFEYLQFLNKLKKKIFDNGPDNTDKNKEQ